MSAIRKILILFWRIWFYTISLLTIIIAFPFLVVIISQEKWYPVFFKIAHWWAKIILILMGLIPEITEEEKIKRGESYVFCPNHTSMIDIMLMLSSTKAPFVFLGKQELAKIPIFGYIYKRTCILVDRESSKSKNQAFLSAKKRLQNGLSICIFPEGKVPDDENTVLDEFHNGAFRLATDFEIPIVPITFYDCKKRFSYTFFRGGPGKLRVKIHAFLYPTGELADRNRLKQKTYDTIYTELINDLKNNR